MDSHILYVSARYDNNICATMHLRALKDITKNLYIVDLSNKAKPHERSLYFNQFSPIEKIQRILELNTWYLSNKRIKVICNFIKTHNISIVFIDDSFFGKLCKSIKKQNPSIKIISFYHDIGYVLYRQWLKNKGIKFIHQYIAGIYGEYLTQKYSDCNIVLNNRDKQLFEKIYKKNISSLLPISVDVPNLEIKQTNEFKFSRKYNDIFILFVGVYYFPNINGLSWFVKNIFVKLPDFYKLVVVGRNMDKLSDSYADIKNMHIIGEVSSLAGYYNNADIVISPIFEGGGMKQKTAEAIAYGKTFIGTTESLFGYEESLKIKNADLPLVYEANTPDEFILAFKKVHNNNLYGFHPELHKLYEANYSLQNTKKILSTLI